MTLNVCWDKMDPLTRIKLSGLFGLLLLTGCNGSLQALLNTQNVNKGTPGFAHGKVGPDGTPVERTPYGQAPGDIHAGENYQKETENPWVEASIESTSTFGVDVDNGSYTLMRDDIYSGRLPHPDGVRPEEYINYFDYGYAQPRAGQPFAIDMEAGPNPFNDRSHIVKIGLQAGDLDAASLRATNLVFLIDTSGSMKDRNKLPLVKESLNSLLDHLRPTDTVGIVTYHGRAGVKLRPTAVREASKIRAAINGLTSKGSTNGEGGIVEAYQLAEEAFIEDGNNRVVLATDGDFNVGRTGDALLDLIADYRQRQITITTVGFGRGNFNDAIMDGIAREGNGNYFYIDDKQEAQRVFGRDLASTVQLVATDVKVQVEFDPALVRRYRLIGYENRVLENRDFDDDTKDAGDIGQGHTVTALYEIELQGMCADEPVDDAPIDDGEVEGTGGEWEATPTEETHEHSEKTHEHGEEDGTWEEDGSWEEGETTDTPADPCAVMLGDIDPSTPLASVRLRHKKSIGSPSQFIEVPLLERDLRYDFANNSPGFRFAVAVAEYAEILRGSAQSDRARFDTILEIATNAAEPSDLAKSEFIEMVALADELYDNR